MFHPFTFVRARVLASLGAVAVAVAVAVVVLGSAGGVAAAKAARPTLDKVSKQLAATSPTIPARMTCAELQADTAFAGIPHFPTSIASVTDVAATSTNPEYCDVQGMIAPQTHFDLKLPVSTWQGRYLQNGCGGYCGTVTSQTFPSCDAQLGGDFAMATDDEGHSSEAGLGGGGLFGLSQDLRVQYGYLSEHALDVVAKTIITAFYGQGPNYSYYDGCSDGGREAMEVAERYPTDFNGIIAGAPEIIAGPLNAEHQTWDYKVNVGADGNTILTADKLPALHAAVMAACAGDDGVNDGIITDPRGCHFNPASIECPAGTNTASCLTPGPGQGRRRVLLGADRSAGTQALSRWAAVRLRVDLGHVPDPTADRERSAGAGDRFARLFGPVTPVSALPAACSWKARPRSERVEVHRSVLQEHVPRSEHV